MNLSACSDIIQGAATTEPPIIHQLTRTPLSIQLSLQLVYPPLEPPHCLHRLLIHLAVAAPDEGGEGQPDAEQEPPRR